MKLALTPSMSRPSAVGILVASLLLAYWLTIQPLVDAWLLASDNIETSQAMLSRFNQVIAERPVLEARRNELAARQAGQTGLLQANSAALATPLFQNDLRSIIQNHDGELQATQPVLSTAESGLDR